MYFYDEMNLDIGFVLGIMNIVILYILMLLLCYMYMFF